jgi:hypothetical protein
MLDGSIYGIALCQYALYQYEVLILDVLLSF